MKSQYSYHNNITPLNERENNNNNNNNISFFKNLNLVSPALIGNTKNLINFYYDHINNEIFNVKNSAYYNQLTRSANFLNSEVSNNWTTDIHTLASINNWIIPNLSSLRPSYGAPTKDYLLLLNDDHLHFSNDYHNTYSSWNLVPKFNEITKSILSNNEIKNEEENKSTETPEVIHQNFFSTNETFQYLEKELNRSLYDEDEEDNTVDKVVKENSIIKDLIVFNTIKNEKQIEVNLKKFYEKNFFNDCENLKLKSKSTSHNSLHLIKRSEESNITKQKIESNTEKATFTDKVEQVDDYLSRPNYVFGYGSLINPDSRGCTVDSTKSARVIKVLAKGLERSWNYNCRDTYTAVGVSKVEDKSIACNGVIIPIDDPLNDLPKLDERECDYRRVQLFREDIEIIHDHSNETIDDQELLAPNAIIWVYVIVDTFIPTTKIPISQIYIDCILMGCIKEGGIEFAKQFIENTYGWNTSVWVNDRTSEHFRKNISRCIIKLTDEIISSIDSLLTTNLSIDVNKRIIPAY